MNHLLLHQLTRSQANDYRLLLVAKEFIDRENNTLYELTGDHQDWVDPAKRNLVELRWHYGEAMNRAANLAFSFALRDLDQYRWFVSLAQAYGLAQRTLVAEYGLAACH
jgi:hypothetical protein